MGKIKDKVFGLVVSKNVTDSLAASIKDNNRAKFYLAQDKFPNGQALDDVTIPNELTDRNVLIINGNRIQGVNQNDISKLNAITNVNKLFKYKGSVETGDELLKKVPPETESGDVWNVEQECEIDGVRYPANTNFVCSSVKMSIDGKPASSTWDSLGGTMQIGTSAISHKINDYTLDYQVQGSNIPITQFFLSVSTNEGLYINSYNELGLNHNDASEENLYHELIYRSKPKSIINNISIRVSTPLYISTKNEIALNVSTGLIVGSAIYLNLALSSEFSEGHEYEGGGFSYNASDGLSISLATSPLFYNDIVPDGLHLQDYAGTAAGSATGGLYISSLALVNFIEDNISIRTYISSLIDEKLKAQ